MLERVGLCRRGAGKGSGEDTRWSARGRLKDKTWFLDDEKTLERVLKSLRGKGAPALGV